MYRIKVDTKKKLTNVSGALYGLFFEDINRAGDGGIYAELLRNRALPLIVMKKKELPHGKRLMGLRWSLLIKIL